jgi:hypothetical protein
MPTKQVPKHIGNSLVGIFVAISIALSKLDDANRNKQSFKLPYFPHVISRHNNITLAIARKNCLCYDDRK